MRFSSSLLLLAPELISRSVDNTSMQLVARPQQFDVMVMPNLYASLLAPLSPLYLLPQTLS